MRKHFSKITIIILLLLLTVLVFTACKKTAEGPVEKIEIVAGSFKEIYELDEKLDLKNAKIFVQYKDGTKDEIPIKASMVSGFDTRTNYPSSKTLKVTYRGVSTLYNYEVGGESNTTSVARFLLEEHKDLERGEAYCFLNFYILNANEIEGGVYAIKFDIEKSNNLTYVKSDLVSAQVIADRWTTTAYKNPDNENQISIALYAKTGIEELTSVVPSGTANKIHLYSLRMKKPESTGSINVKNITLTNGQLDAKAPSVKLEIKPFVEASNN